MGKIYLRPDGTAEGIYSDDIPYSELTSRIKVERASHVEWDEDTQSWAVRFAYEGEWVVGFETRQKALDYEVEVIEKRLEEGKI